MKNYFITLLFAGSLLLNSGCDVINSFETLPINIPISLPVSISGNGDDLSETQNFCLENFPDFNEYQSDIEDINFVELSFRTKSFSPTNLRGNISFELMDASGNLIFMDELNNISPAEFEENPYVLQLSDEEINLMNQYLDSDGGTCFTGKVNLQITDGSGDNELVGIIDIVFEAETKIE